MFLKCMATCLNQRSDEKHIMQYTTDDLTNATKDVNNKPNDTTELFPAPEPESEWLSFDDDEKTWRKIRDYALLWNARKRRGIIKILLQDDVDYKLVVRSAKEFEAIANILRVEKTVYYNIISGSIASAWQSISDDKTSA